MKKSIIIIAGAAVLAAGAYFSAGLLAQQGNGGAAAAAPVAGTRVAVVNIGHVFNKYVRAEQYKKELEATIKPYKERAAILQAEIQKWTEAMRDPKFDPKEKDRYETGIRANKHKLEDMQHELQKLIGKKQEDNLVTLWREVNTGIDRVAKAYGFQIVLAYGDPIEKEQLDLFPNVNRKMAAMDAGSTIPLYVHGSVDLSQIITDTLNSWAGGGGQNQKKDNIQPTSGGQK